MCDCFECGCLAFLRRLLLECEPASVNCFELELWFEWGFWARVLDWLVWLAVDTLLSSEWPRPWLSRDWLQMIWVDIDEKHVCLFAMKLYLVP